MGPRLISAHPSMKGKPSPRGSSGHRSKKPLRHCFPDGTPGGVNSLQSLPMPRLRRAPGQRSRGQGEVLTGCTCTSWCSSEEGEEAHVCPLMPQSMHCLGVTPQSIPLGDGADVYLTERGREGMERRWNRKEQKEEKCLHLFYQSFLVSHISPATPGKEATD